MVLHREEIMSKKLTKTAISGVLCGLLTVIILFSGCAKITFLHSIKMGMEIEKCDFSATLSVTASPLSGTGLGTSSNESQEIKVILSGTVNNPESMFVDVTAESAGTSQKLTTIILNDDKIYVDISQISQMMSAFGSTSDPYEGKKYISADINELTDQMTEDRGFSVEYDAESVAAINSLFLKICDVVELAATNVDPAVLGQDGDKFTFNLSNDNIESFLHNLAAVLETQKDQLISAFTDDLKVLSDKNNDETIEQSKEEISEAYDEVVDELKSFTKDNLNGSVFDVTSYSQLTTKEARVWDFGISGSAKGSDEYSTNLDFSFDINITENKEDKELPTVSADETIDYNELMNSNSLSSLTSNVNDGFTDSNSSSDFSDSDEFYQSNTVDIDTSNAKGGMFDKELFVTVNGKDIELPAKFKTLTNAGLKYDTKEYTDSKLIDQGSLYIDSMYFDDKDEYISVYISDMFGEVSTISDSAISSIDAYDYSCFDNFSLNGDITFDATMDYVISKYGKDLNSEDCTDVGDSIMCVWYSPNFDIDVTISFSADDKEVEAISVNNY